MKIRMKRVQISPDALLKIMIDGSAFRVLKGLPKDSITKGITIDPYANTFFLFVEHESFDEVDVESVAPLFEVKFKRI